MRIGHISPFWEQVSVESQHPQGGMIFHLTEQFTRLGHDVTVFASGDSRTAGTVVPVAPFSMQSYPAPKRHLAEALAMLALEKAFATVPALDIIHVHSGLSCLSLMCRSSIPIVATVYESLDVPEVIRVYREFKELALIATSAEQITHAPDLNWQAVIPYEDMLEANKRPAAVAKIARAYETVYEWSAIGFGRPERAAPHSRSVRSLNGGRAEQGSVATFPY
ncbi:MAG: glycosyltransferase [Nitrospira sp.]|nr:glycosyltransferase [Nitrospira sp.]